MTYCIKFGTFEVFAKTYRDAIACAVQLAKDNLKVSIWQGSKEVWSYNNS